MCQLIDTASVAQMSKWDKLLWFLKNIDEKQIKNRKKGNILTPLQPYNH